jgi:hypothetical protein
VKKMAVKTGPSYNISNSFHLIRPAYPIGRFTIFINNFRA